MKNVEECFSSGKIFVVDNFRRGQYLSFGKLKGEVLLFKVTFSPHP